MASQGPNEADWELYQDALRELYLTKNEERCGAPVSIYGTCTKLGCSRSYLILSSRVVTCMYIQAYTYIPLIFLNFLAPPPYAPTY